MKYSLIAIAFFLFTADFHETVLKDTRRHGYYVAIRAKINGKTEEIVVENYRLYTYVTWKEGVPKLSYVEIFKDIIENGKTYEFKTVPDKDLLRYTIAISHPRVDSLANIGTDALVRFYFRGEHEVIKDSVWGNEKTYLIKKLFEKKIGCKTDDESGYLYISRVK